jgi:hypothetical protein
MLARMKGRCVDHGLRVEDTPSPLSFADQHRDTPIGLHEGVVSILRELLQAHAAHTGCH